MRARTNRGLTGLCAITLLMVFCLPASAREAPDFLSELTPWQIPDRDVQKQGPTIPEKAVISDPEGDTFGIGDPQLDISQFSAETDGADLWIQLDFFTPISPADSGQPDAIIGLVDIDADQDPATGNPPISDFFCPLATGAGADFFINLGSYTAGSGSMDVFDENGNVVGAAQAQFEAMSVSMQVALADIGGDDGIVDTVTVIGTFAEPTDCAIHTPTRLVNRA